MMGTNVEFIEPFIESAVEILRQTTRMQIEHGTPRVDDGPLEAPDLSVVLGIAGDMQGRIVYGIGTRTAMGIVGRMMGGVEVSELDEIGMSAIAELGNMIVGAATGRFERMGVTLDVSPPTILSGRESRIAWPLHRTLVVPLETEVGTFALSFDLEDKKDRRSE